MDIDHTHISAESMSTDPGLLKEHNHSAVVEKAMSKIVAQDMSFEMSVLRSIFWRKGEIPASQLTRAIVDVPMHCKTDLDDFFGQTKLLRNWAKLERDDVEARKEDGEPVFCPELIEEASEEDMDKDGETVEVENLYPRLIPTEVCLLDLGDTTPMSTFMIRQEYIHLYDLICRIKIGSPASKGIVVRGQPGIGKSVFLWYILVQRLLKGLPSLLHYSPENLCLFSNKGIHLLPTNGQNWDRTLSACPDLWCLTDSNMASPPCPAQYNLNVFMVQVTSPRIDHYKIWAKHRLATEVNMDVWTWPEVYLMHAFLPDRKVIDIDHRKLHDIYIKYGPTARLCNTIFSVRGSMKKQNEKVHALIGKLGKVTSLLKNIQDGTAEATSHDIFLERPSRFVSVSDKTENDALDLAIIERMPVLGFLSDDISQKVFKVISRARNDKAEKMLDMLCSRSMELVTRHACQELLANMYLQDNILHLHRRQATLGTQKKGAKSTNFEHIGFIDKQPGIHSRPKHSIHLSQNYSGQNLQEDVLYIPKGRTFPTFDSMLLSKGILYLFQITYASVHSMNISGLERLKNSVSTAFQPKYTGVAENTEGLTYKFVFVIPSSKEKDFWPAEIDSKIIKGAYWKTVLGEPLYIIMEETSLKFIESDTDSDTTSE